MHVCTDTCIYRASSIEKKNVANNKNISELKIKHEIEEKPREKNASIKLLYFNGDFFVKLNASHRSRF